MNPRREARGGPVTARRDRPELPGFREGIPGPVPPYVPLPVVLRRLRPAPPRRDHCSGASPLQILQQPVRAGRPVAGQGPEPEAIQKLRHAPEVVRLAGKDREPHGMAQRVHDRHGPAGQATPGTPGSLSSGSPSAPAASYVQRIRNERRWWLWKNLARFSVENMPVAFCRPSGSFLCRGRRRRSLPAAAVRGPAPQDGLDRYRLGSQLRIRPEAWSARPPVRLPGPGWMPGFSEPDHREDRSGRA